MTIRYCVGDATQPVASGGKLIVHVCNDKGGWGAGFTGALSKRWPEPERRYRSWIGLPSFRLGGVQLVPVATDISVVNMIAQRGYFRTFEEGVGPGGIVYEELHICLLTVAGLAALHNKSVHMPRIGCGLAGGRWEEVEPIVAETLNGLSVTVYDLK